MRTREEDLWMICGMEVFCWGHFANARRVSAVLLEWEIILEDYLDRLKSLTFLDTETEELSRVESKRS